MQGGENYLIVIVVSEAVVMLVKYMVKKSW